jgi:predicted ATPase
MSECARFVLTGGPGVGKTSVLEALAAAGYPVVRETARDVIREQQALDSDVLPWRDKPAFQRRVLEVQLAREASVAGSPVFLDRGIPDGIAYLRLDGLPVFPELLRHAKGRYMGAFLLEPPTGYQKDAVRFEDEETAQRIHRLVEETYCSLGYRIVTVPAMTIRERVARILAEVERWKSLC